MPRRELVKSRPSIGMYANCSHRLLNENNKIVTDKNYDQILHNRVNISTKSENSTISDEFNEESNVSQIYEANFPKNEKSKIIYEAPKYDVKTYLIITISVIVITFVVVGLIFYNSKSDSSTNETVNLQNKYNWIEDDFVQSFLVLVKDTIRNKQPKCFILLYGDDSVVIEQLLNDLSSYASCKITECNSKPTLLLGHDYGPKDTSFDYGKILTSYEPLLSKNGIMIVKNLESMSGNSAMAFQSLCDEYQPLVPKAVVIFTIKVDNYPTDKTKYVEQLLRQKWKDLNDDFFYPLFTRISNFIFSIHRQ